MSVDYPGTRRDGTVDHYHGRAIADPYRWMEDLDSPDIRRWIDEQNVVTERYLHTLADQWAFAAAHAGLTTAAVPESGSRPER
jgi:prolyl oligopeptidase